nr:hypothetical protein [uncultured archaeon]
MAKQKILITGAAGFLGTKLRKVLGKDKIFSIIGTDLQPREEGIIKLDITDKEVVIKIFKEQRPNVVIHTAAMSDVDGCEDRKELAWKINVDGTKNIVEGCNAVDCTMLHISTDFVFDGERGNYTEHDTPNPLYYYAKTKYAGEQAVQDNCKDWIIVRPEVLYGFNGNNTERSFTVWAVQNLKEKKRIDVVNDQYSTPTLIDDIAHAIGVLIKKRKRGIWHVAGPDRLSRHDMAVALAEEFGLDKKLIIPITSEALKQKALRPRDSSLNTEKLKDNGIMMHGFREGVKMMREQMEEHKQ